MTGCSASTQPLCTEGTEASEPPRAMPPQSTRDAAHPPAVPQYKRHAAHRCSEETSAEMAPMLESRPRTAEVGLAPRGRSLA